MKIRVLTAGGTIDKVYFDQKSTYEVGDTEVGQVLSRAQVGFEYSVETLFKKDSLDMTDEDRQRVRQAVASADCDHVLVTHGTDTMIETAKACRGVPGKVVVFTGSSEPSRFHGSHAIFNLGCAIGVLQVLPPGVYIAMNGRVFDPDRVRKNRTLGRFEEIG
jgi:L-asparaginase